MSVHPESLLFDNVSILANIEHRTSGQFVGPPVVQAQEIIEIVDGWPGIAVLIESFHLRQIHVDLTPVKITSMLEFALFEKGISAFFQQPSEAKGVATDARLKAWGLYRREGGQEHARDADRHAITWIRKCKERENLRAYSWPYLFGPEGEFAAEQRSLAISSPKRKKHAVRARSGLG